MNTQGCIFVSDRFSFDNHLPGMQMQLCCTHVIRELTAIAEHPDTSGKNEWELLPLQQQLFWQWHQSKDGTIDINQHQQNYLLIRQRYEDTLQRVVDMDCARKERTPRVQSVHTCHKLLQYKKPGDLLDHPEIEPTNNATKKAPRQSANQRKTALATSPQVVLSAAAGAQAHGRVAWESLEQDWIAYHCGGQMPSLLPDPGSLKRLSSDLVSVVA